MFWIAAASRWCLSHRARSSSRGGFLPSRRRCLRRARHRVTVTAPLRSLLCSTAAARARCSHTSSSPRRAGTNSELSVLWQVSTAQRAHTPRSAAHTAQPPRAHTAARAPSLQSPRAARVEQAPTVNSLFSLPPSTLHPVHFLSHSLHSLSLTPSLTHSIASFTPSLLSLLS